MADKPLECLHCCIAQAINRHAESYGATEHSEVLVALAMVTTQILLDARGADQYSEDDQPPSGALKH